VKIIDHKTNKGLSATRNTGVAHAMGEWYIFVDSDDYISPNFTKKIKTHLDSTHNLYIYNIIKDKKSYKIDKKVQKYKLNDSLVSRVINNSIFNEYRFPEKYRYAIEDWDFYIHEWTNLTVKNICYDNDIWYYYRYNSNSLSKAKYVYRSRLLHAIKIYDQSETRQIALTYKLYGHYYIELLMLSRIWFPDLLPELKGIKYRQKVRFMTRVISWITRIWFIKNIARKSRKRIDE
jgi:glycosyltransferase involved in cell wall biosynthesis